MGAGASSSKVVIHRAGSTESRSLDGRSSESEAAVKADTLIRQTIDVRGLNRTVFIISAQRIHPLVIG